MVTSINSHDKKPLEFCPITPSFLTGVLGLSRASEIWLPIWKSVSLATNNDALFSLTHRKTTKILRK